MIAFSLAMVCAALAALLLTPLMRCVAFRVGAVDQPGGRHSHRQPIPRLGGIAIALAILAPVIGLYFVQSEVARQVRAQVAVVTAILLGSLVLCVLGALDDTRGLRARTKLLVQLAVASGAYLAGVRISAVTLPIVGVLEMGSFALPVTVLWIVAVVNAVNLIDGLDGLAAGVVFTAAVTNFVVAYQGGSVIAALFMAATGGALLGFLVFNFNPARIFMGDSGSYLLGYVLAASSVVGCAVKASTTVSLLVPIMALGLPLFDTAFSMLRRSAEGRSPFAPDRGHLHHRLVDKGLSHRRAVLLLYAVSTLLTLLATAAAFGRGWQAGLAVLASVLLLLGLLRYASDGLRWRRGSNPWRQRELPADAERLRVIAPQVVEQLRQATDLQQVRAGLRRLADSGGFLRVGLWPLATKGKLDADATDFWVDHRRPAPPGSERLIAVEASYWAGRAGGSELVLRFEWLSESARVSAQADVLLQILADLVARALEEGRLVAGPPVPALSDSLAQPG